VKPDNDDVHWDDTVSTNISYDSVGAVRPYRRRVKPVNGAKNARERAGKNVSVPIGSLLWGARRWRLFLITFVLPELSSADTRYAHTIADRANTARKSRGNVRRVTIRVEFIDAERPCCRPLSATALLSSMERKSVGRGGRVRRSSRGPSTRCSFSACRFAAMAEASGGVSALSIRNDNNNDRPETVIAVRTVWPATRINRTLGMFLSPWACLAAAAAFA